MAEARSSRLSVMEWPFTPGMPTQELTMESKPASSSTSDSVTQLLKSTQRSDCNEKVFVPLESENGATSLSMLTVQSTGS